MSNVRNAPFSGPQWVGTPFSVTIQVGASGTATRGPNQEVEFALFSVKTGSQSVSMNNTGTASVGVGGCPLTTTPIYFPCKNLNQLYFVSSDTVPVVNVFGY